ncbi:MAG: metal-dependent hydrolase [Candidatus Micrarchaeota archaeon]
MLGRSHLLITFLHAGAILYALSAMAYFGFLEALAVFLGALAGALLPDVDAVDALAFRLRGGGGLSLKLLAYTTKWVLYKPVTLLARLFGRRSWGHRGGLHSLAGAGLVAFFWLGLGTVLIYLSGALELFAWWFFFCLGIGCGFLLHLWQDSLTAGGIRWLPTLRVQGRLLTGYWGWRVWKMEGAALAVIGACSLSSMALVTSDNPHAGLAVALLGFPLSWLAFGRVAKFREFDEFSTAVTEEASSLADPLGMRPKKRK